MTTLIVGGGLSGLALARLLQDQGRDYLLVEARDRFGGRIKTHWQGGGYFDLGPAWFWDAQPRIAALIDRLGLRKFEQFSDGELSVEDANGHVQRGQGFSSMQGSWRLEGGLASLTTALAETLETDRTRLAVQVVRINHTAQRCTAILASGDRIEANHVVLAMPPRIAAGINFSPALPAETVKAMQNIPTWMAGQAKALALYDRPFWRDAGLSGDAMSRRGPMVEIHDASPSAGGPFALFGFIGVPPHARTDEQRLCYAIEQQLVRLFGPQAATSQILIKDWARDPHTSTQLDQAPLYAHPTYGLAPQMDDLWNGALTFAGTEVAPMFGGYLEGALEAAERAFANIAARD